MKTIGLRLRVGGREAQFLVEAENGIGKNIERAIVKSIELYEAIGKEWSFEDLMRTLESTGCIKSISDLQPLVGEIKVDETYEINLRGV